LAKKKKIPDQGEKSGRMSPCKRKSTPRGDFYVEGKGLLQSLREGKKTPYGFTEKGSK